MRTAGKRLAPAALLLVTLQSGAWAAPDYWDSRLNQVCGLFLQDNSGSVPEGQGYWRLVRGEFEDESQSGFNHHIYYKALDVNGNPIENQKTWTSWNYTNETGSAYQFTKGPGLDDYWGNFPMYASCPSGNCGWPYNAWIDTTSSPRGCVGPSDKVYGMGMHNPFGTPCGAHVNFRLTWRWTIKAPTAPRISRSPAGFADRHVTQGGNLPADVFTVYNSGGGTLTYNISESLGWLSVSPTGGSSTGPGQTTSHTITYAVSGLAVGTYSGNISINSSGASNSPQTISVTVIVDPLVVPGDMDRDLDVDQADFGLLQACLTGDGAPQTEPACTSARLDADDDVDIEDVNIFRNCYSGPGRQGDPGCNP